MADTKASPALLADPAPLGLAGFALTTFILSLWNAGVLAGSDVKIVIGLGFFYGGIAQLLAGMWEFRNGNTFGEKAGPSGTAVAYYLLGWAIFTALMTLGTFRLNGALVAVFVLLTITFLLLSIGAFNGAGAGSGLTQIGGWVGILTAIAAWYTALAGILRGVSGGKMALPIFPMGA